MFYLTQFSHIFAVVVVTPELTSTVDVFWVIVMVGSLTGRGKAEDREATSYSLMILAGSESL